MMKLIKEKVKEMKRLNNMAIEQEAKELRDIMIRKERGEKLSFEEKYWWLPSLISGVAVIISLIAVISALLKIL